MSQENIQDIIALGSDEGNMFDILKYFPDQVKEAMEIAGNIPGFNAEIRSNNFAVLGMGGSAIGGDLLASYTAALPGADHINILINRTYNLPAYINKDYNVIASSYSGNTEETISGFKQAAERGANIISLTTGGELAELSEENNLPKITVPAGLQPRCAIAYSFFPILYTVMNSGAFKQEAIDTTEKAIEELIQKLDEKSKIYTIPDETKNPALMLAKKLVGTVPVVYSSSERMNIVNLRWRGQFHENSKTIAFGNLLPEMNHNEINSWNYPTGMPEKMSMIFIRDVDDHPRIKIRFDAVEEILEPKSAEIISVISDGQYLLTRMFDMIYLGDWVSYWLALLNGADPTPIPDIMTLKAKLSGE